MPKKNIGIVKSYGSIELWSGDSRLSPASDIFFREHASALRINDIVSFKITSHWQGVNVESWGVDNITVLNPNDLSPEIILLHFNELSNENKLAAFEKYFDTLSDDRLAAYVADMENFLSPDEILNAVADKKTFNEKFPLLTERSEKKFLWAQYFTDNPELFRQAKLCDDVMIFFMYEVVKRITGDLNDVNKLIKLLKEKEADIESSPHVKIIYSYICAAFAKHYAKQREDAVDELRRDEYLSKHEQFLKDVDEPFTKIFNDLVRKIETQAENPDEKFFIPKHDAHVLPPCENYKIKRICSFCEAVTWQSKQCNYCPRLNSSDAYDAYCFRIDPKLNLSAEDWSVIELMEKLDLVPIKDKPKDHKVNREFFRRIGGEFNRLKELLDRLKCRKCGNYMRAVKNYATWKTVKNLRTLTSHEHFAVFNSTVFSCQNEKCSEKDKTVYLSYCWHCHAPIDSRDNHVRIEGYYLCKECGAGYRDPGAGYALVPGTICPNCGGQTLNELTTDFESRYKKYVCSSCNHRIEFNSETLKRQLGEVYAPLPLKFLRQE